MYMYFKLLKDHKKRLSLFFKKFIQYLELFKLIIEVNCIYFLFNNKILPTFRHLLRTT